MTFKLFLFFTAYRIANVILIQSQFDPDEYWQNLEPSYCYVFGDDPTFDEQSSCPGLTWEWKRRQLQGHIASSSNDDRNWSCTFIDSISFGLQGPVRSFASILPTLIFYSVIKKYRWDSSWMVSRGPFVLNAILVAATTDWTVWYTSKWMQSTIKRRSNGAKNDERRNSIIFWCVYCQLSSWFNAYTLIRTYSNSLETLLLSLSFALISPVGSVRMRYKSQIRDVFVCCKVRNHFKEQSSNQSILPSYTSKSCCVHADEGISII
jgi:phosphatidylinositol glycan class B